MFVTGARPPVSGTFAGNPPTPARLPVQQSACFPELNRQPAPAQFAGLQPMLWGKKNAYKEFFQAIEEGNKEAVDKALASGLSVTKPYKGTTPLMHAAWNHQVEIVKYLLEKGADPNRGGGFDHNPLMSLLTDKWTSHSQEQKQIIDLLLPVSVLDLPDYRNFTALTLACQNGFPDVALELIRRGANVKVATRGEKMTPLMYAAWGDHANVIEALIHALPQEERLEYVNAKNKWGRTALQVAMSFKKPNAVHALLRNGASMVKPPGKDDDD